MKITPQRLVDIAVQKLEYRRLWNPEFVLIAIKGTEGKFERVGLLALQKHVTFRMNGVEVNMILDISLNITLISKWNIKLGNNIWPRVFVILWEKKAQIMTYM